MSSRDTGEVTTAGGAAGGLAPQMLAPTRGSFFASVRRFIRYDIAGAVAVVVIILTILIVALGPSVTPYTKDQIFTEANPDYNPRSSAPEALSETRTALPLDTLR